MANQKKEPETHESENRYQERRDSYGLGPVPVLPEVFFALSFDGRYPQGAVTFHEALKADGQQAVAGDA